MNTLFIISAPSGAGKTSLVKALLEKDEHLKVSVSYTTRPKRSDEKEGVNYHFVSDAVFTEMIKRQEFLEHAKVFGHFYGTSKKQVENILKEGKDVILEIDWQGARQVRELFKNVVSIFILPPSKESLRERLQQRGQDKTDTINRRMAQAEQELAHFDEYHYLVVNDDFETAYQNILSIVLAQRLSTPDQKVKLKVLLKNLGL